MCLDKWRVSDIRNLNYKPVRLLLFVTVCLVMVSFFCVPGLAVGEEWLEYEDVFDSSNSVAVVRLHRSVDSFFQDGSSQRMAFDDIYLSELVDGTITFFNPDEITLIKTYAQDNSCTTVHLNCSVTLLYRKLNNESAEFPITDATSFNCNSFQCTVNILRGSNWGGLNPNQTFSFKYRVPGSSVWVDDTATAVNNTVTISRYISNISDSVYYKNSLAISEFSGTFEFHSSNTNYFDNLDSPVLSFSFSNIYQYSLSADTGTETAPPESPETTSFNPGVDTFVPSDTMQGIPDDIDNTLDDRFDDFVSNYTEILNGLSWTKFSSCFGFIGQFFGLTFLFEPFADILNAWAIFAVFNILLGGFITGVSAYVRTRIRDDEKKEREAKAERERIAKRNIERQRSSSWWSDD